MPIVQTTPQAVINAAIERKIQAYERAAVRNLCYCGEECVNHAKAHHTFRTRTGNLASSMGYVVVKDGKAVRYSSFSAEKGGAQGGKDGKRYAAELAARCGTGLALIVVAGMNYAKYVSGRGYDVLDSAERLAERIVPTMLRQLDTQTIKTDTTE